MSKLDELLCGIVLGLILIVWTQMIVYHIRYYPKVEKEFTAVSIIAVIVGVVFFYVVWVLYITRQLP